MLYYLVRPIVRFGLRILYRKIDLAHLDRIPKDKAVILAANHPTTFIEPCILACYLDRPLNFLARGDFFSRPLFVRLLNGLHILPVFRLKDGGYGKLKRNYDTFSACYKALAKHKTIMILAEGRCIHEKKLRPLRKGTARIALGALQENPNLDEVYIVPIGVNFTYADRSRSEVMISCNEPILASKYFSDYEANPNQAINNLLAELREKLEEKVITVPNREDEQAVEYLHRLYRTEINRPQFPIINHQEEQLLGEKGIAYNFTNSSAVDKQSLEKKLARYFGRLEWMGISDSALAGKYRKDRKSLWPLFWLFVGSPILLWHCPPIWLGHIIPDTKIKALEFHMPVKAAIWPVAYLLYNLIWMLVGIISGSLYWIILAPILTFLGIPLLYQYEKLQRWRLAWRAWRQTPPDLEYVKDLRKSAVTKMQQLLAGPIS